MKTAALEVFKIFSGLLGDESAGKVVEYIEDVRESGARTEQKMEGLATKADLANVKAELEVKIAQSKAELIKWMFIFWITQTLSILGLLAYFLK